MHITATDDFILFVFLLPGYSFCRLLSGIRKEDIEKVKDITILAESEKAGVFLAIANEGRKIFVMGHPEYDRYTLDEECLECGAIKRSSNPLTSGTLRFFT